MFPQKAILQGEIELSDPLGFHKCLSCDGGMLSSAVLLIHEDEKLVDVFNACSSVKHNDKGGSGVRHINWKAGDDHNQICHQHFANPTTKFLNIGFKDFEGRSLSDKVDSVIDNQIDACTSVAKRNCSLTPPLFLPDKCGELE